MIGFSNRLISYSLLVYSLMYPDHFFLLEDHIRSITSPKKIQSGHADCLLAGPNCHSVKETPYTDSFSYHSTPNAK